MLSTKVNLQPFLHVVFHLLIDVAVAASAAAAATSSAAAAVGHSHVKRTTQADHKWYLITILYHTSFLLSLLYT